MTHETALGPLDFVLVEFPQNAEMTPVAAELAAVLDRGIVRLFDVAAVLKDDTGSVSRVELDDEGSGLSGFEAFAGAASGLFDESDLYKAGEILEQGMFGLLIAVENTWAGGMVTALAEAEGRVVASERIPAQELLDALDALDASEPTS
ncbi:MAG: DUF6325 family protein [Ornithinimicrobium sp.]